MRHVIEPDHHVLNDTFSREHRPVARIDSGDTLVVRTLDCMGHLARQTSPGEDQPVALESRRGHCLVGPIAVTGATVGQVLAIHLVSLRPDDWGFTVAGGRDTPINHRLELVTADSAWLLWELDAASGIGRNQHSLSVRLAPFLGVIGVSPSEPGEHSTIPPRPVGGGNIDCKELVAGATLFLPVAVADALLYLGDGHAAQGDGEVGGTAIEAGMTTELVVELLDAAPVDGIHAVTPTSRITFGFSDDLNVATGDALAAMITWLERLFDVDRATAMALASTAVDLRVTQVVNQTWGVHAVLDHDRLTAVS